MRMTLTDTVKTILQWRYWATRAQRDAHQAEVYKQHPELERLDRALTSEGYRCLARAAQGEAYADDTMQTLRDARMRYLTAHNMSGDYAEVKPFCRLCGDTGLVDGQLCACAQALCREHQTPLFDAALDPDETFATLDETRYGQAQAYMHNVVTLAKRYVECFFDLEDRDLLFMGPQGRGKTFLLNAIGNALEARGVSVCFVPAVQLFFALAEASVLRTSFHPDADALALAERRRHALYTTTLLLIDDLGLEPLTSQTYSDFIDVLNMRRQRRLYTVIATNQSFPDLKKNYDSRVASRLAAFASCRFQGDDLRVTSRVKPS